MGREPAPLPQSVRSSQSSLALVKKPELCGLAFMPPPELSNFFRMSRCSSERLVGVSTEAWMNMSPRDCWRRIDMHGIAEDPLAAVRRRAQPDDLRPEFDAAVILVAGDVGQRDLDGHGGLSTRLLLSISRLGRPHPVARRFAAVAHWSKA